MYMVDQEYNSPRDLREARLTASVCHAASLTAAYQHACREVPAMDTAYGWSLYLMLAELRERTQGEARASGRVPIDRHLFYTTAPKWNCVDYPGDGMHYVNNAGDCRWCGMTEDAIAKERNQRSIDG